MKPFRTAMMVVAMAMATGLCCSSVAAEFGELVALCEDCHGPAGVSADSDVPTIAGQRAAFLDKTMRTYQVWGRPCIDSAFRHGDTARPETDMCEIAEGLTGEEIRGLADHFSALPFRAALQPFDADLALTGKALHTEHCEQCHAQGGTAADRGPRLAGQWAPYLRTSLKFVPTGEHLVPPAMESTVIELGQEDIDALMNFYASQQD